MQPLPSKPIPTTPKGLETLRKYLRAYEEKHLKKPQQIILAPEAALLISVVSGPLPKTILGVPVAVHTFGLPEATEGQAKSTRLGVTYLDSKSAIVALDLP